MPADRARPVQAKQQIVPHHADDIDAAERMIDQVAAQVSASKRRERWSTTVDLAVGANVIRHALGRVPTGANVTPTTADASFAWALTAKSDSKVTITVVGVPQDGATLEVF